MKTQCLQTNETQQYWKGKCLRSERWSRERVVLIKSLIYKRWKETRLRRGCQIELNLSADIYRKKGYFITKETCYEDYVIRLFDFLWKMQLIRTFTMVTQPIFISLAISFVLLVSTGDPRASFNSAAMPPHIRKENWPKIFQLHNEISTIQQNFVFFRYPIFSDKLECL